MIEDVAFYIHQHKNYKNLIQSLFNPNDSYILSPESLLSDEDCDLGKWIDSQQGTHKYIFELNCEHKIFHYLASTIITYFQLNNEANAKILIPLFNESSEKIDILLHNAFQ